MAPDKRQWLGPGIWADGNGALHIDLADTLAAMGVADTPANREVLTRAAAQAALEGNPDVEILEIVEVEE
jgi:hypothetical protein